MAIDPSVISDVALLTRLQQRDADALAELYDRHGRAAFSLAYRVLGNPESAEEAVQEGFLALWRRAETYHPDRGAVRTWLLTVVRNRAIDQLRRTATAHGGMAPPASVDDVIAVAPDDPEAEAVRMIEGRVVRAALAELPGEQREVVELAYFAGLSYPEVAARTGVPLGTVKSRMRLALERLRGILRAQEMGA